MRVGYEKRAKKGLKGKQMRLRTDRWFLPRAISYSRRMRIKRMTKFKAKQWMEPMTRLFIQSLYYVIVNLKKSKVAWSNEGSNKHPIDCTIVEGAVVPTKARIQFYLGKDLSFVYK
ncbi:hypothetical protein HAX54_026947 [Datura stramonium]|uniref:Uncharacterized protein n=1 Tax=Datura stramonium TaxID=4076 RepID=A0ABS8S8A5_DATST|nr:hypothetical protein [Datura stramonium]